MNLNENIPVNNTQYRESILVCKNKENFIKLCQAINSAKSKLDEFVNVYAIGKLKIKLSIKNDLPNTDLILPAGTYFIKCGGEQHLYQSSCNMIEEEQNIFKPQTQWWRCVFFDDIVDVHAMFDGIDADQKGVVQENPITWILELPNDKVIKREYIDLLDSHLIPFAVGRNPMRKYKKEISVYEFEGYFQGFRVEVHQSEFGTDFFLYHEDYCDKIQMFHVPKLLDEEEIRFEIDSNIDIATGHFYDIIERLGY